MIGCGLSISEVAVRSTPDEGGGGELEAPPEGFAYLVNADGKYIVNGDGGYILMEV